MAKPGDVIGGKYELLARMPTQGGMGEVWRARLRGGADEAVVKFCVEGGESTARFAREVRLMMEYAGNGKVVRIIAHDLEHAPPYFIMPLYNGGNLWALRESLVSKADAQEAVFDRMADCVGELHRNNHLHRDLKPENFLVQDGLVSVSDLGLGVDPASETHFTRSSAMWGTPGYVPPEFLKPGGFRNASVASDIYMLGKSYYALLSGGDPTYLDPSGIEPGVFMVVEKCCHISPERRYQSIPELRQALKGVFDIVLGRVGGVTRARALLTEIQEGLRGRKYSSAQVRECAALIAALDDDKEIDEVCQEVGSWFFDVLTGEKQRDVLPGVLRVYSRMVDRGNYGWSFAEIIADCMRPIVESTCEVSLRILAFKNAAYAARSQNRFAAMDTCVGMMQRVEDAALAHRIAEYLAEEDIPFLRGSEPSSCRSPIIAGKLRSLRNP